MAASSGNKKKVDIRELMKQQRAAKQSATKRIESPLAKYNNIGQLICVVCNQPVKTEILWNAHIQGKKHRDNVLLLKAGKTPGNAVVNKPIQPKPQAQVSAPVKRKADPSTATQPLRGILKKPRGVGIAYDDSSEEEEESDAEDPQSSLPSDFFDDAKKKPASSGKTTPKSSSSQVTSSQEAARAPPGLPADFFDSNVSSSTTSSSLSTQGQRSSSKNGPNADVSSTVDSKPEQDQTSKPMSEVLPEGFFDDPVQDAKVRNVEVRNTMEEEWEKFQKEMETQKQVSETLAEEDDEAAQMERNIDEIDEQIQCFAKVESLWNKQDEMRTKVADRQKNRTGSDGDGEEGGSDDEAEFEEFLNWRSKGAWK
ncbi:zinc finger protein 830-like [Diadema setosum]|uniref:zinc finger protein 830-like n=1 Tax=Diadema setosum TaxID=31175 RepID=UPI003B3BA572